MSESTKNDYPTGEDKSALGQPHVVAESASFGVADDILGSQSVDPALDAKMHIVNNVRCPRRREKVNAKTQDLGGTDHCEGYR